MLSVYHAHIFHKMGDFNSIDSNTHILLCQRDWLGREATSPNMAVAYDQYDRMLKIRCLWPLRTRKHKIYINYKVLVVFRECDIKGGERGRFLHNKKEHNTVM